MRCNKCKKRISKEAEFCSSCGTPVEKSEKKNIAIFISIVLILVFLAMIMMFFFFKEKRTEGNTSGTESTEVQYHLEQETDGSKLVTEEKDTALEDMDLKILTAEEYANYKNFCKARSDESEEAMERYLSKARENIFYLMKAYDALGNEEYQAWASVEEIFTEQVIDTICDGDPFAMAAVKNAITSFQEGDSLSEIFGSSMMAAVQEIPSVAKDAFLEELLGGYVLKSIDVLQGTVDAANAQKQYALSLLKEKMNVAVDELVFLLSFEDISGEDLARCANIVSEIYTMVQEVQYRFGVEMPVEEWKTLYYLLYADAGSYEDHSRRKVLYDSYLEISQEQLAAFLEEKALTQQELEQLALDIEEYYELTFLVENAAYLSVRDNCETLRSMDYAQMNDTIYENMLLGGVNAAFGNFLTDMLMAEKISNDTEQVYVLYQFVSEAEKALESCRSGIDGLESILDDTTFMVYEFYNVARCPDQYSVEEQNYMWFIFDDYYQGEGKPTLARYQELMNEYCKDVRAYEMLLETCILPAQKALLDMSHEVNSDYIKKLENDVTLLKNSCDTLGEIDESTDTYQVQAAVTHAYIAAVNNMVNTSSYPPDTQKFQQSVYVDTLGNFDVQVYMRMDENHMHIPFYIKIEGAGRQLEIYSYTVNDICAIIWDDAQYITYSTRYQSMYHPVRVSSTNIEDLDDKDVEWLSAIDLEGVNDDYYYVSWATGALLNIGEDSVKNATMIEQVVKDCAQMWTQ